MSRRAWVVIGAIVVTALAGAVVARSVLQGPAVIAVEEKALREYTGVYQWGPDAFIYLQIWNELTGTSQLGAFDESGEVRMLFPSDRDRFFAGPGAAVKSSVESRIEFQRDGGGRVQSLTWQRGHGAPRVARRVEVERHEDVLVSSGGIRLAGTLIAPKAAGPHPAVILVHGSGPATREWTLPFARFLVRHGVAVLGYDKRGAGGSTGDWNQASFDDLAGDVVAAFAHLKTRSDIDPRQIGLLGISQAGWVMPLAAVRAPDIAFLISISGPGVPGAETTIDHARNEMVANGMTPRAVESIIGIMTLQYTFARTGQGWNEYAAARQALAARMGSPPESFPGDPDHPHWQFLKRLLFYDPAPTLRQLRVPTLAIFGELDNNITAAKNKAAWDAALSGHPDYTARILPRANHIQLEAKAGTNAEMASLQRFVPEYFTTVRDWLAKRVRGGS
jgi:pimeloyl-ACP methyl ester carboxylesterase